ncbi:MAG: hypothetical protein ACR2LL_12475 [Nitrosopumilus sp.]
MRTRKAYELYSILYVTLLSRSAAVGKQGSFTKRVFVSYSQLATKLFFEFVM